MNETDIVWSFANGVLSLHDRKGKPLRRSDGTLFQVIVDDRLPGQLLADAFNLMPELNRSLVFPWGVRWPSDEKDPARTK